MNREALHRILSIAVGFLPGLQPIQAVEAILF